MRALIALLALALFAAPAAAQGDARILGGWVFETGPHPINGCIMTGAATISPGHSANQMRAAMRTETRCPDDEREVTTATEDCIVARNGAELAIACTLVSASSGNYVADGFALRILSPTAMEGRLDDQQYWDVPVRWRRTGGDVGV